MSDVVIALVMYDGLGRIARAETFFGEAEQLRNTARNTLQQVDHFKHTGAGDNVVLQVMFNGLRNIAHGDNVFDPDAERMVVEARNVLQTVNNLKNT